jgi:hypothetical protein
MTIQEMHQAVKLELDKTSALELPSFEPEEIDYWLNKAIITFIKSRYSGINLLRESFEQTQRRMDDIRILVTEFPFTSLTSGTTDIDKPYSYLVDLDLLVEDYLYRVGEEVEISYVDSYTSTTYTKRQGITECTSDTYRRYVDNPYSEHRLHHGEAKPLRLFKGNFVELITDSNYSITKYYLRYLRYPTVVSYTDEVDCELPDHTHSEIVNITVSMMLENIESIRHRSFREDSEVDISLVRTS